MTEPIFALIYRNQSQELRLRLLSADMVLTTEYPLLRAWFPDIDYTRFDHLPDLHIAAYQLEGGEATDHQTIQLGPRPQLHYVTDFPATSDPVPAYVALTSLLHSPQSRQHQATLYQNLVQLHRGKPVPRQAIVLFPTNPVLQDR